LAEKKPKRGTRTNTNATIQGNSEKEVESSNHHNKGEKREKLGGWVSAEGVFSQGIRFRVRSRRRRPECYSEKYQKSIRVELAGH